VAGYFGGEVVFLGEEDFVGFELFDFEDVGSCNLELMASSGEYL
jgi:hypothetical protein